MFELGGTDIWSPAAVEVLQALVAKEVFNKEHQKTYMETPFDEEYVAAALRLEGSTSDGRAEQRKAAKDYWNRTKLLFGVLSQ